MNDKTRKELLAEAWDKSENPDSDDEVAVVETENENELQSGAEGSTGGDEGKSEQAKPPVKEASGKTTKEKPVKEVGTKPAAKDETDKKEQEAARREAEGTGANKEPPVTDRAPQSWKPGAREHWGKIPAEARAEIRRIDLEVQRTMSQTAQIRKFANDFAQVVNPYSHLIRAQNSTPLQAVHNLMQTAAGLMQGSAHQKAEIVAEIMKNYGVDFRVLDEVLTKIYSGPNGQIQYPQSQPQPNTQQVPEWARPMFNFMDSVQQQRTQHEQQMREAADDEISKMEGLPYFDDLRDSIADIMEFAAKRSRKMTLQEAYEKAIDLDPEVSKLVKQKKEAEEAAKNKQHITRARKASATLSGAPAGKQAAGASGEKLTRRQQLSEAWDNAER